MADPNIQTLIYPMSVGPGIIRTYQTDVNKKTGSSVTYDVTNLGQKDAVWRSEREVDPTSGKVFYRAEPVGYLDPTSYYENLSDAEKKFIQIDVAYQSDNQRAAFINKNYTPTQRQQLFAGMPKVQNTGAAGGGGGGGGGGSGTGDPPPNTNITDAGELAAKTGVDINLSIDSTEYRKEYAKGYDKNQYYYPVDLASNKQDRIKFTMKTNEGSTINTKFGQTDPFKRKEGTTIKGEVYLPIQPSITDSNSVDWSGGSLNPVAAAAAGASLQLIKSDSAFQLGQKAGDIAGAVMAALRTPNAQNAMNVYFAQEAVGIQGLLSRTTGAVLNPNLELLFGGPTLRPFSFTFRLSPRDEKEANSVREIIRFFKQGMAVKKASTSAFLKSPNIFDIKYLTYLQDGTLSDHPAINRIKTCALIGCDVDYTPDGTYMTFNDSSRTMTSYQLSLRFSELDPIYESDYGDNTPIPNSHIGY